MDTQETFVHKLDRMTGFTSKTGKWPDGDQPQPLYLPFVLLGGLGGSF
jgi:hypothetical protein